MAGAPKFRGGGSGVSICNLFLRILWFVFHISLSNCFSAFSGFILRLYLYNNVYIFIITTTTTLFIFLPNNKIIINYISKVRLKPTRTQSVPPFS